MENKKFTHSSELRKKIQKLPTVPKKESKAEKEAFEAKKKAQQEAFLAHLAQMEEIGLAKKEKTKENPLQNSFMKVFEGKINNQDANK